MHIRGSTKIAVAIVLFYCLATIFIGLVDVSAFRNLFVVVMVLVPGILFFGWCVLHSRENELKRPKFDPIFVALIPILGIPFYFLRRFGIKNGLVKTLKFAGVVVCIYMPALTASMWLVNA